MNRKTFILHSGTAAAAFLASPISAYTRSGEDPEPYKTELVKEFVIAGHGNADKVKEMLATHPNLLYCRYDWGNGDFEEAIEGAAHVGNTELANYLLEQGSRPNLFVLTMLGETALVRSMIDKYPSLLNAKGAHGLTLLHHAIKGGERSKELVDYFKSKGLTEMQFKIK
jgi:ankyrin repeat protein